MGPWHHATALLIGNVLAVWRGSSTMFSCVGMPMRLMRISN